jgi:hypothetical protein
MDSSFKREPKKQIFKAFFKAEHIAYYLVFALIIYTIFHSILSHSRIDIISLGIIVISLFLIGSIQVLKEHNQEIRFNIKVKDLDILYSAIGVIATYELATLFSVNVVIASAFMGLLGYLLIKKNSVAFYCGTFAGMTSYEIFNHFEILVLAGVCALVYLIIKHILDGYGGKLGTTAFISTLLTATILGKDYLSTTGSYNIVWLLVFSVAGVMITYVINNKLRQSPVLSSALPSLIVAVIIQLLWSEGFIYSGIFFTASFIGMSDSKKIPNAYVSILLGIILGVVFILFFNSFNGFGGKMGLMAMLSLFVYQGIRHIIFMFNRKNALLM